MTSEEMWERAVDVAQIVSALATFATVVVATRLWARQFNPRLRVAIDNVVSIHRNGQQRYVSIDVTNIGLTPVIVSGLGYRLYHRSKTSLHQMHDYANPLSAHVPLTLAPGQWGQFLFEPDLWYPNMTEQLYRSYTESLWVRLLWKRQMRVEVRTSTGTKFKARLTGKMIERLEHQLLGKLTAQLEGGAA